MTIESFSEKKQILTDLLDKKIALIYYLIESEKEMATLIKQNSKEWVSGFPIESIHQMSENHKMKTRLGDFKRRSVLIKSCNENLDELDSLDSQVKISLLDLIIEKINFSLSPNEDV